MKHVVPYGGVTLMPYFLDRLRLDMEEVCPRSYTFGTHAAPDADRPWLPSIGGSVLTHIAASLPDFWVTKAEYDEWGASALRRKCF